MYSIVYKSRGIAARGLILSELIILSLLMSFLFIPVARAIEAASINSTSVSSNGLCLAGNQTGFLVHYMVDPDTNDIINSDTQTLYLLDGNNIVLDSRNLDIFRWNGNAVNLSTVLFTKINPTKGPFRLVIHDNASLSADFSNGSSFSAPADKIVADQSLDAHGLDSDCPAPIAQTTTNNSNAASNNISTQQNTITPDIMNQQTNSFISGVSDNARSLFAGRGTDPVFNPSSFTSNSSQFSGNFSLQSTGLKRWLNERRLSLQKAEAQKNQKKYGFNQTVLEKQAGPKSDLFNAGDIITADDMTGTYNWWIKGSGTYYNGAGFSYKGTQFDIVSGLDYRLNKHLIAGMLFGYGRTDFDISNAGVDGKFDADGYSVGPYIGLQLDKALFAEALIVYTRSDYESSSGTTRGAFDADRVTTVVNLRGRYELGGGAIVEPGIGFLYAHEEQEAYRDSGGTTHSKLTVKAGRVSVGPKITLPAYTYDGGKLSPWFAIKGEYDFSNQERAAGSTLPDTSDFFSMRAQVGVESVFGSGSKLSLKADASGLLSDKYIGLGGQVRYDLAF